MTELIPSIDKVDAYDNKRRTALLYAARFGRTYAVSRLLDAKASLGFADRARALAFVHSCIWTFEFVTIRCGWK